VRRDFLVTVVALLCLAGRPLDAQVLEAEAHGVMVTNRHPGGPVDAPARGIGIGGALGVGWGRFAAELAVLHAETALDTLDITQTLTQLEARARYAVIPQVAIEASLARRYLDPDFAGSALGFVSAGVYGTLPVSTWGRFWARMAYIPYAGFSGTGDVVQGLSAEAGLGFEAALVGSRVYLVGSYGFQRVERRVRNDLGVSSEVPIELDAARLGVSLRLGGTPSAASAAQPE
jgi:hypothetical protein